MPRYFVHSRTGDGDTLAWRLKQEGHEVVLRTEDAWCRANLQGMVEHTQAEPRKGDIVVFGTSKSGEKAAAYDRAGLAVVASAPIADTLEMDRWAFMQTCKRLGIETPPTYRFTDYNAARDFLREHEGRYVFKPSGDQDCAATYVAREVDDLLRMLTHFEKKIPADFLLQEFYEGCEISLEGWFNGEEWVDGAWNATMETKKLMAGDIGPATGCSTSTVWPYDGTPRWARRLHYKFTEILRKGRYRGPFDLNNIVTKRGIYTIEPTPRFGYHAIENFVELWEDGFGEVLAHLASGELDALRVDASLLAASVRLALPPYPSANKEHRAPDDVPVLIEDADWRWLWPSGIRYEADEDSHYSAPTDGVIGALVGIGTTLERATKEVKDRAGRVEIPDVMWRNDVGNGDGTAWKDLDEYGFDLPPTAERLLRGAPAEKPKPALTTGVTGMASPFGVYPWA